MSKHQRLCDALALLIVMCDDKEERYWGVAPSGGTCMNEEDLEIEKVEDEDEDEDDSDWDEWDEEEDED